MQNVSKRKKYFRRRVRGLEGWGGGGGGGRVALLGSYDSQSGKAPSDRSTFFKLQVY